ARPGAAVQCPLLGYGQPLSVRDRVLQSGLGLGEGAGREERPGCASPAMAANAALSIAGGPERLAGAAVSGAMATDSPWPPTRNDRRHPGRGSTDRKRVVQGK